MVFLVMAGLNLVGLGFGGTVSDGSGLEGADFPPRAARVRAGASSCNELRRCDARVGAPLGVGIGPISSADVWYCFRVWSDDVQRDKPRACTGPGRRSADRKPGRKTENELECKIKEIQRNRPENAQTIAGRRFNGSNGMTRVNAMTAAAVDDDLCLAVAAAPAKANHACLGVLLDSQWRREARLIC